MSRNWIFALVGLVLLGVLLVGTALVYFMKIAPGGNGIFTFSRLEFNPKPAGSRNSCLKKDEFADYPINPRYAEEAKAPLDPLVVSVRDSTTQQARFTFTISDVNSEHYHPLELHRCGVYVLRRFNYDSAKSIQEPGYKEELWRYGYDGNGKSLFVFAKKDATGVFLAEFNNDFRVDPNEQYLVMEKSYLGHADYALVVKGLAALNDLLILNLRDVIGQHPDVVPGSIGLGKWSDDGKHLFGDIFQGALSTAYYVIEAGTWEVSIYAAPPDILAGVERAVNFQNLHLAYVDIPTFTGFQEVADQLVEEARKMGRLKNLFVYNLRTREATIVASIDPGARFNLKWISDTELEYFLPDGERRVYQLPE